MAGTLLVTGIAAAVTVAGVTAVSSSAATAPACGVERWSVKTLQDPAGQELNVNRAKKTSVNALRQKPVVRGPGSSRCDGVESTVYEVRARLVEAKLEEDSDIHLVIRGVTTPGTMIVEFPLSACAKGATKRAKIRMMKARKAFVAACGMPGDSSFTHLTGRATIRGVGFFDFLHGQAGVAPNGIELHPVLRFAKASCRHVTSPAPSPAPVPSGGKCDPSYPTVCIPPPPPDLNCADVPYTNFKVLPPDPHHFDGDKDGVGCES